MANEVITQPVDALDFDPENPRLPTSVERTQQSMLDHLAETTSIEELMVAIGENDFFQGEPLVVIPHAEKKGRYIVVEGNRRLAAVKLLSDPALCSRPRSKIREISTLAKYRPDRVPVVICPKRADVLPYLGFRHITGIKQWDPLAKARYIYQLFSLENPDIPIKRRYRSIAQAIGGRSDTIKRSLDALAVYKTIEKQNFFDIEDLDDVSLKFSLLSTAIADNHIAAFVGATRKEDEAYQDNNPIDNPACLNGERIEELTRWLFERDAKGATKIGESRNLRLFSAVADTPRALTALRSGASLKVAYQLTTDMVKDFSGLLYQSETLLTEAAGMVATVPYDEESLQVAHRILENIRLIGRAIKQKKKNDDDDF